MDSYEIERLVVERLQKAIEEAVAKSLLELNEAGCDFIEIPDALFEWIDRSSKRVLAVNATLGVSVAAADERVIERDPEVDRYLEIAMSGEEEMATALAELEGDIANGGFLQLYDNKGPTFLSTAIGYLRSIQAMEAAGLVQEALEIINDHQSVMNDYDDFLEKLGEFDTSFCELRESIPHLYLDFIREAPGRSE